MPPLKQLAIRGTFWTLLGYGGGQTLRFCSNLILTRLLLPEIFGLSALINLFMVGLSMFSDIGVGPSIIYNKRGDDPKFLNTAWTIQVLRGVAIWLCTCIGAIPFALFYNQPQLAWLIPVSGLTAVIAGFNSTSLFIANRHLRLRGLTLLEISSQIVAIIIMILWAWKSPTIWSLIAGNLASVVWKMLWSHQLFSEIRNCFAWDSSASQELFSFGRWVFLSTIMTFLATQADRLILGKLFSLETFGVYIIAFTLATIPLQVIQAVNSKIIFPFIAKYNELPRSVLREKILKKRKLLLIVVAIGLALLIGCGDWLILKLYSQKYVAAAWMFPILAIGIWPRIITLSISPALLAIGKPIYGAVANTSTFLFILIGLPLGFMWFKILGAVIVVALYDLPAQCILAYGLHREGLGSIWQDLTMTLLLLSLLMVILLARYSIGWELSLP